MDLPPYSSRRSHRPLIYVNLEFGVSWSPNHAPNGHAVRYRSRGLRERSPNFPRQVAPRNTNYLAATAAQPLPDPVTTASVYQQPPPQYQQYQQYQQQQYQQQQQQQQEQHQHHHQQHHHQHQYTPSGNLQPPRQHEVARQQQEAEAIRRSSRDSPASHERGRSAPPPISDNTWDVVQPQPAAGGSSTQATTGLAPAPRLWKALPDVPPQARLFSEGIPWTSWSWPTEFDPNAAGDAATGSSSIASAAPRRAHGDDRDRDWDEDHLHSPVVVTIPSLSGERPRRRGDSESVRDLEALGQAMMTIDNGFEDQWWYQGERQATWPVAGGDLAAPQTPVARRSSSLAVQDFASATMGWAGLREGAADDRLAFATANTVSPVSAFGSPMSPPRTALTRTLSTRSEELWLSGDNYE